MLDPLRHLARSGGVMLDALRTTGVAAALRPRAVVELARAWRTLPRGPTAVVSLHALNTPDKEALVDLSGDAPIRRSYRELDEEVGRLSSALASLGVRPGDRVALMMRNGRPYLVAQWAITRLGAFTVQIGYRLKAPEVRYILENSQPAAFLYQRDYAEVAREARSLAGRPPEEAMVAVPDRFEELLRAGDPAGPRQPSPGDFRGGIIVYTSGTTGKPKGASRGFQRNLHLPMIDFVRQVGIHHEDRHLVVCPLYHSAAPAFMALTYMVGGTVVLMDHFDPEKVLETIARERISSVFMVPTMLGRIVALPEDVVRRRDTRSLRWVMSGAAPLPTETARRFEERFGRILFNFYGATETGMVTLALPGEHTARPGTIGRALWGNEIRLLDEGGREVPVGEVGELWVKNSMIVAGYYGDEEATRQAMRDGFFSVGDLARRDEDGYYYLADRKSDMVISGGVNIYPLEIEQHLHSHPAILEAAVIGVPDSEWGEALRAFVVRRPGMPLDEEEVRRHCKRALADYKCPKQIVFVDALPRNPTGKVLKRELRRL